MQTSLFNTKRPFEGATFFSKSKSVVAQGRHDGPRRVQNQPLIWSNFIDNVWEQEDFEEALLSLEGMVGPLYVPLPSHIRQLLALSLSPLGCLPPSKSLSKRVKAPTLDPAPYTVRKIRLEALRLLLDIAHTNTSEAIFRAAPGHAPDPSLFPPPPESAEDEKRARQSTPPLSGALTPVRTAPPYPPTPREDFDGDEDEDDLKALALAGKRVAECEDVWDLVAGVSGRGKDARMRTRENPLCRNGWDLLKVFVEIWEDEVRSREASNLSSVAPSLLRQFKPPPYGPKTLSTKVTDIIFWPYIDFSTAPSTPDSTFDDRASMPTAVKAPIGDDLEMDLAEKKRVSSRLLALTGQLAMAGCLEPISAMRELATTLKSLSLSSLTDFIEHLPPSLPLFNIRLFQTYLELYSRTLPPLSSSNTGPPISTSSAQFLQSQPNGGSPSRRRALGINGSGLFSPSNSQSQSSQPFGSLASSNKLEDYFALPALPTIATVLSKLPSELATSSGDGAPAPPRRRPSGTGALPPTPSFGRIASNACVAHELVKECLLEAVLSYFDGRSSDANAEAYLSFIQEEGEARKLLEQSKMVVEEARKGSN